MILYPNAKINLGLKILRERPDKYHDIETVFYPIPFFDILEIIVGSRLTVNGEISMLQYGLNCRCNPGDNLCLKAYRILREDFDLPPVEIYLHKNIPTGSGLGGGSSDASFTLHGLNELFGLNLSNEALAAYALKLGSDCPFFIYNTPMIGSGRGEILEPVSIPQIKDYQIKTIYPNCSISTKEAYNGVVLSEYCDDLREVIKRPVSEWRSFLLNDFESSVFKMCPEISACKKKLYDQGAEYASMSGSGSAVYGLFKK